jgi:hypothetical protein
MLEKDGEVKLLRERVRQLEGLEARVMALYRPQSDLLRDEVTIEDVLSWLERQH